MLKKCLNCNEEYNANYSWQKFCSKDCHYKSKDKRPAWNKGLTKEIDKRLKNVSSKVSNTLKRKYRTGELINSNKGKKLPFKLKKNQKITNISHEEAINQEINEYQKQGFRCIELTKVFPDFIAVKDNKIYAIEVEFHTPNYEKYNEIKTFDDIIWIRYKKVKS